MISARVPRIPVGVAMAPRAKGGAGHKAAQDYVSGLWQQGLDDAAVRQRLREDGYKAGRISQLIKATRPAQGQAGPAAAASKAMAKPAVKKTHQLQALPSIERLDRGQNSRSCV